MTQPEFGFDLPVTPKRQRPKDAVFEALVVGCSLDPRQLTRDARGALNAALRDIREVRPGVTPQEVANAINSYRKLHPTWELTPKSLAKHWPSLVFVDTTKFPPNVREQLHRKEATA